MEINWHEFTKRIGIMQETLRYPFVCETYPLTWPEITDYCGRLLRSDPLHRMDGYADYLAALFQRMQDSAIQNLVELVIRLSSRESIIATAQVCDLTLAELDSMLNYLAYSMLPRNFYLRDIIQKGDKQTGEYCAVLRKAGYPNSLDLLQKARTPAGRQALSQGTGVPEDAITQLVHRADFTRCGCGPNMVNNYFNSGFDTVEKLAASDLEDLVERVTRYMASIGKVPKYGIDLPAHRAQVILMPKVVVF